MRVEEQGVAEDRAGAENADGMRPLDRRHAVTADHGVTWETPAPRLE